LINEVAQILVEGFRRTAPDSWPTLDKALNEVQKSLEEGRISRVAVDDLGHAVGWIGGLKHGYPGEVWELHPLVVKPECQGTGIGAALVADLEKCIKDLGGLTVMLGADDEMNLTSLSGKDLYPGVQEYILNIRNLDRHPYEFYQKQGYVITGVVPDANGWGKPDIMMSKRVG
jgi:aminoglycoside 6'-N-acetyltransferase I